MGMCMGHSWSWLIAFSLGASRTAGQQGCINMSPRLMQLGQPYMHQSRVAQHVRPLVAMRNARLRQACGSMQQAWTRVPTPIVHVSKAQTADLDLHTPAGVQLNQVRDGLCYCWCWCQETLWHWLQPHLAQILAALGNNNQPQRLELETQALAVGCSLCLHCHAALRPRYSKCSSNSSRSCRNSSSPAIPHCCHSQLCASPRQAFV